MASLSPGAVELPMSHVSVRVAWHDTDWTGKVCASPSTNHCCSVLKNVKEYKNPESEEAEHGRRWSEVASLPPCVNERAGFMRTKLFTQERNHRYAWNPRGAHAHFGPTEQRMPPYSLEVIPFRWVMLKEHQRYSRPWDITFDQKLEDRAHERMTFDEDTWIQDHRNQLALLDSFFSALRRDQSLVFLYAKDLPLVEERRPGERYLLGAGFVRSVDPVKEWEYKAEGELRSVMWERGVAHSIRPNNLDGFLLPYHALLKEPGLQGSDLSDFVARTPPEHFDEFSYVSELVSHDGAIAALTELARVVDLLPGVVEGPWSEVSSWIADRIAVAWRARGPYPGLGPMLAAAGLDRGTLLARRVLDSLEDSAASPWPEIESAIAKDLDGLAGRVGRRAWERLLADAPRYRQLRVMSRFALSGNQARALFEEMKPAEVIDNPYALYEQAGDLALTTIDRGLWPQDVAARAALEHDPIDDPVREPSDDRRVRAAAVAVLRRAADHGHTLLDEPALRKGLVDLPLEPPCDPVDAAFSVAVDGFQPLLVARPLARDAGRGWQLATSAAATDLIAAEIRSRAESALLDVDWDWHARIEQVLPTVQNPDALERRARAEKASALEVIARCPIAVLVGSAGTGKTSMLEALCADPNIEAGGILLLAPTGKAAVQLAARTGKPTQNLAQLLYRRRWTLDAGYFLDPDAQRHHGASTVVIDEASMLSEMMLAATLETLEGVERLVLCGDPRQLPPIEAGRPFADIVAFLRDEPGPGGGIAELHTGRRQVVTGAQEEHPPDDVAVASLFSLDAVLPGADEALARVLTGQGDGRIEIRTWADEAELHAVLVELLSADEELGLGNHTRDALCGSFGARCEDGGLPNYPWGEAGPGAERWQLLSPVRARPGGVVGLNELVRRTWRAGDVDWARRARGFVSPVCADQVIFADKVMCLRNDNDREAYRPNDKQREDGHVANGEIGLVVGRTPKRLDPGLRLEFSSQAGRQYTFWEWELNGDSETRGEWLELAYAVTVHKSQGSQFATTYVVVPDPCPLLSPELLYTALTRQRDRVVVLKQGETASLREFAAPARSETARRLTCLFRPADPWALGDGTVVDGAHVHRTRRGTELVRSKSEVIVADVLHGLGLPYAYELELQFVDEFPRRPDFTIPRQGSTPVYWEHLGMLDLAGYRADWDARKAWYASHDILPWKEGGGPSGTLVWSDENVAALGIDSQAIEALAREVFDVA